MSLKSYFRRIIRAFLGKADIQVVAKINLLAPSSQLLGKKILITGGGRGLGAAMAKKFIQEGASVLITGRNEDVLKKTSKEIGCKYLTLDMSEPKRFEQFMSEAEAVMGNIDGLVNNAGISLHESTLFDVTEESFDQQINTNLKGGYFLAQMFIKKKMEAGRGGTILFVSSETGETVDFRPYGLTKAATNSLVQGLAHMYAKHDIRINAVAPGVTASDMTGYRPDGNLYCDYSINKRVYLPEEVAEVACFLMSDVSGVVSGQIITCNNSKTVNARWK